MPIEKLNYSNKPPVILSGSTYSSIAPGFASIFDKNKDDVYSEDELQKIDETVNKFDKNKDKKLDEGELSAMAKFLKLSVEELKESLNLINGTILAFDICQSLHPKSFFFGIDAKYDKNKLNNAIAKLDKDNILSVLESYSYSKIRVGRFVAGSGSTFAESIMKSSALTDQEKKQIMNKVMNLLKEKVSENSMQSRSDFRHLAECIQSGEIEKIDQTISMIKTSYYRRLNQTKNQ